MMSYHGTGAHPPFVRKAWSAEYGTLRNAPLGVVLTLHCLIIIARIALAVLTG
jgi:hypothetical protein